MVNLAGLKCWNQRGGGFGQTHKCCEQNAERWGFTRVSGMNGWTNACHEGVQVAYSVTRTQYDGH